MPLSFPSEDCKIRSTTLVKLLTYSNEIVYTNCISVDVDTSSMEIAIFYQTVEMGARHPNYGREIARERGHEGGLTRGGQGWGEGEGGS